MKVIHIHRQSKPGVFSIEELFHAVAAELREDIEVIEYEAGPRKSMLMDAWRIRKMKADVYHVTGDIHYMVLLLPWHKTVLTVHDIVHFLLDLKGIKRWLYKWIWLLLPIRTARAVTSISKTTVDRLVEHLGISRSKVIIIDNCHSPLFKQVPRAFNTACPVILQVGTRSNKNVPRLIAALRGIPCKLVLIGKLDESIQQQLNNCGTNYENRVNLSHAQIVQAYVDCDIVAFISLAEGFGVPIIEAQATGRPLVTSNIFPMIDVAGAAACLVPPTDLSGIREGFLRIINDDDYRSGIVAAGVLNAARYSPTAIRVRYLALYKRTQEHS
ncbi:MAG: glycosyltransferase [Glaciimonas sp.]|nr:glycosyltransferase [Glaciimonas sp.]